MQKTHELPVIRIYQKSHESITTTTQYIKSPKDGLNTVTPLIAESDREHFVVVCLDTKHQSISIEIISVGSLNFCTVHPREIFKGAILSNAAAILLAHNHPSQNLTPSQEDILITKRLAEAGEILGIEVLDHLIINSQNEYCSLKEQHLI